MGFSGRGKLVSELDSISSLADTDIVQISSGNVFKKMTIAQLKDQLGINALNTNRYNATSALTETWFLGHSVRGWGLIVPICTNRIISVEKAEIYDDTSNWKPLVFQASFASSGNLWVQFTDDGSPSTTIGQSYLVRITGAIV